MKTENIIIIMMNKYEESLYPEMCQATKMWVANIKTKMEMKKKAALVFS